MSPRLRIREQRQLARTYARPDALTHMAHPRTLLQDFPSHSIQRSRVLVPNFTPSSILKPPRPQRELTLTEDLNCGIQQKIGISSFLTRLDLSLEESEKWIIDLLWETWAGAVANFSWEKVRSPHFSRIFPAGLSFLVFSVVITLTSLYFN